MCWQLIYIAAPLLVLSGGTLLAIPLISGLDSASTMGIAIAMGVCFSIGLMQAQYVALRSKSGRKESTSAAESIASQDLSALARNVPPNIAMTQVAQEDRVQVKVTCCALRKTSSRQAPREQRKQHDSCILQTSQILACAVASP